LWEPATLKGAETFGIGDKTVKRIGSWKGKPEKTNLILEEGAKKLTGKAGPKKYGVLSTRRRGW